VWLEQLIAGSTGKHGRGIVPVVGEPLGGPEVYGADRVFVRLGPGSDTEWHRDVDGRLAALTAAGHPLIDIRLDDASWVGAEFFRWQFASAVAAIGLGVDPFEEPDIGDAHEGMTQALEIFATQGHLPDVAAAATRGRLSLRTQIDDDGRPRDAGDVVAALRGHLRRAPENGYFQVGAWFAPTVERTARLQGLQARLRDATGRASTFGYGPRYLHTTGQLHKGGPATGCFIQLTGGSMGGEADVPIPGREETFGVLLRAQALGDLGAFATRHLPALAIDLGDDVDAGLDELAVALDEALT
jgi:transaldolase/glucose-6-phosphate isomerase